MKVEILDDRVFSALDPLRIEGYLRSLGWKEKQRSENEVAIWESKRPVPARGAACPCR